MRWLVLIGIAVFGCSRPFAPVEDLSVRDSGLAADVLTEYVAADTDWPGWRGPDRNSVARSPAAPTTWTEDGDNIVWTAAVPGRGHASPVVRGDRVILATALENEETQAVVAFDRSTGDLVWQTTVHQGGFPSRRKVHPKGTHANSTVACDDEHIFIAFLNNDAVYATALDFAGTIVWQTKLGPFASKFGYAPSPTVYKSFVIFAADNFGGGYLAAVHRRTGELAWRKQRPRIATYSSAIVAHVAGRDQLLISGCDRVNSYDPNTGEELWSCPGTTEATCGTMIWNESLVFAAGGFPDRQVIAVRADGSGQEVWRQPTKIYEPSMLAVDDYLYAVTDDGIAHCWATSTGETQWKKRLGGSFSASPVHCNGFIYVSSAGGETFVFEANPDKYVQVAKNKLGDDTYATLAICDGNIFLRAGLRISGTRQETLYCIGASAP